MALLESVQVPLSLHGLCGSTVLVCPGGGPPSVGHGGRALAAAGGFGVDTIGFGVGLGGGFGVGRGVGRAVGVGVLAGIGAGVESAVGAAVGAVGAPVGGAAGPWPTVGPCDAAGTTFGDGDAAPAGDGIGWPEPGCPVVPGPWLGVATLVEPGVGVVTTATRGCPDPSARCWSPTPPMPMAIVARTRFRTPRLRTRRAR
jgi:hypothetical protein